MSTVPAPERRTSKYLPPAPITVRVHEHKYIDMTKPISWMDLNIHYQQTFPLVEKTVAAYRAAQQVKPSGEATAWFERASVLTDAISEKMKEMHGRKNVLIDPPADQVDYVRQLFVQRDSICHVIINREAGIDKTPMTLEEWAERPPEEPGPSAFAQLEQREASVCVTM